MNEINRARQLRRSRHGRMLAGVCAGLEAQFPVDANLFRLAFVVGCFFGGAGLFVYVAAWLLIPEEGHDISAAQRLVGQKH